MDIKTILRENALLIVAFCIPLIVFFIVMTISTINKSIVRDPEYGLLIVDNYNAFDRYKPYNVLVEFGKLVIEKNAPEPGETTPRNYDNTPVLFLYDPLTAETRMLDINYNRVAENRTIVSPTIRELNNATNLLTTRQSPDGYIFSHRTGRISGFLSGGFHQGYALYKDGRVIPVTYRGQSLPNPQFLAWVDMTPGADPMAPTVIPDFNSVPAQ